MIRQPNHPEQDPAEGSRDTVDKELARQGGDVSGAKGPKDETSPGEAPPSDKQGA